MVNCHCWFAATTLLVLTLKFTNFKLHNWILTVNGPSEWFLTVSISCGSINQKALVPISKFKFVIHRNLILLEIRLLSNFLFSNGMVSKFMMFAFVQM